ncbi:MAG: hypothetical protein RIF41_10895 [Polyangiaceae bacterium]
MKRWSWLVALVAGLITTGCYVEQAPSDDDDDDGASAGASEPIAGPTGCLLHSECPQGTLCHFEETTCGQVGGTCQPANGAADAVTPACSPVGPVCGCDGITYDSACGAWDFGVSVWFDGTCEQGPPPEPEPEPEASSACGGGCGAGLFCHFADNSCGTNGGGECVDPNGVCTSPMKTVCGCDGMTYTSKCDAVRNGTSVAHDGGC